MILLLCMQIPVELIFKFHTIVIAFGLWYGFAHCVVIFKVVFYMFWLLAAFDKVEVGDTHTFFLSVDEYTCDMTYLHLVQFCE